jgi:hypothetical protein
MDVFMGKSSISMGHRKTMAMSVITRDGSNYIVALEPERILKKMEEFIPESKNNNYIEYNIYIYNYVIMHIYIETT